MKAIEELVLPTQEDIIARIESRKAGDPFGFEVGELINFLEFEKAGPYLADGVDKIRWNEARTLHNKDKVLEVMKKYYPFAWEKANHCRGISANRSVMHFWAWVWLMGDHELLADILTMEYEHYGKEILIAIGERYGWDWKALDNGERKNTDA